MFFLHLSSSVLSSVFVIHKGETHGAFVFFFCTMSRLQLACAHEPSSEVVLFSSSSIVLVLVWLPKLTVIQRTIETNVIALLTTKYSPKIFPFPCHFSMQSAMAGIERTDTAHRDMTSVTVKFTANIEATETGMVKGIEGIVGTVTGTARSMEVAV